MWLLSTKNWCWSLFIPSYATHDPNWRFKRLIQIAKRWWGSRSSSASVGSHNIDLVDAGWNSKTSGVRIICLYVRESIAHTRNISQDRNLETWVRVRYFVVRPAPFTARSSQICHCTYDWHCLKSPSLVFELVEKDEMRDKKSFMEKKMSFNFQVNW